MIDLNHVLVLSLVIFVIGAIGTFRAGNIVLALLASELMLNAAAIAFVAGAVRQQNSDGHFIALFFLLISILHVIVGAGIAIAIYRDYGSIRTDFLKMIRG